MHLNNLFNETIRKEGDKYVVRSKKGKSMGKYDSKSAAEKRLRQVEMFKHMAESIKLSEAERDIQVEVPGIGVYTADTLSSNIIQSIDKLHRAAEAGDWEQVEYSLDPSKMGATLLTKAQALVQALKQNRMLEATATDSISKQAGAEQKWADKQVAAVDKLVKSNPELANTVKAKKVIPGQGAEVKSKPKLNPKVLARMAGKLGLDIGKLGLHALGPIMAYMDYKDVKDAYDKGDYDLAKELAIQAGLYAVPGLGLGLGAGYEFGYRPNKDMIKKGLTGPVGTDEPQAKWGHAAVYESELFEEWTDNVMTEMLGEAGKDACYHKVKSRYKVWPSAYASGALVKCRKVGAKNWGNKSKKK